MTFFICFIAMRICPACKKEITVHHVDEEFKCVCGWQTHRPKELTPEK